MKIFKTFKKQTLVAISGLTMILNAGIASSSIPQASAMIDWSTFKITGYALPGSNDPVPTYTLSGQSSSTSSNVSDWGVNWSANTSNNASSFSASIEGNSAGTGSASVTRSANIAISGTGLLWISASYELNAAINSNVDTLSNSGYTNSSNATVSFNVNKQSSNSSSNYSTQENIYLGNPLPNLVNPILNQNPTVAQKQDTLYLGIMVNNGDSLNFSSTVNANASDNGLTLANIPLTPQSIPVPAAIWLFGSALLGFVGLGRHRQAVMA